MNLKALTVIFLIKFPMLISAIINWKKNDKKEKERKNFPMHAVFACQRYCREKNSIKPRQHLFMLFTLAINIWIYNA